MKHHGKIIESYLWKNYHIAVDIDESGWEGVLLHHEEIDRAFIPEGDLAVLPDPLLFHMTSYEYEKGSEWLFALASHPDDVQYLYYATCILNDELFNSLINSEMC